MVCFRHIVMRLSCAGGALAQVADRSCCWRLSVLRIDVRALEFCRVIALLLQTPKLKPRVEIQNSFWEILAQTFSVLYFSNFYFLSYELEIYVFFNRYQVPAREKKLSWSDNIYCAKTRHFSREQKTYLKLMADLDARNIRRQASVSWKTVT